MEPIKIYISVSQLGTLIGLSKYGSFTQLLVGFFMKADFQGYSQRILELEKQYNKSFKHLTESEKLEMLSNELGLSNVKDKTNIVIKNSLNNNDLLNQQNNIMNEINNQSQKNCTLDLTKEEFEEKKKTLGNLVNSFTNRGYGINHENSVIDLYSKITSSKITQQQKTLFYQLKSPSNKYNIEWYLKGKIDGLATTNEGKNILVEIKNRTKSLFGVLKDYEKPQIQTYLKLMNLQHGHLVEHIKTNKTTNIIDVYYEEDYWKMLKKRLTSFINFFNHFLENKQLQNILLMNEYNEEIEKYFIDVRNTFFS